MKDVVGLVLVIVGALLLAVGVFLPLVSAPFVGSFTLITSGDSPRIVMFVTGIAALVLCLVGQARHALWPGLIAAAALAYGWFRMQAKIAAFEERFADGPMAKLARKAAASVQMEWGWAVLVLAVILIVLGAILAWRWKPRPLTPVAQPVMVAIGAIMVAAGVFLPLVRVPRMWASIDMLGSDVPLVVMFVAGLAALVATLLGWTRHALWPGLAGVSALGLLYYQLLTNIGQRQADLAAIDQRFGDGWFGKVVRKATDLAEKRFGDEWIGKAADKATELIQLQWGWAVLSVGLTLIITAGMLAWWRSGSPVVAMSAVPGSPVVAPANGPAAPVPAAAPDPAPTPSAAPSPDVAPEPKPGEQSQP